jgi:hypothetical protein
VRTIDGKPRKIWGRSVAANPSNLSNVSQKDELFGESHTESGANLSNLSNLYLKKIEINSNKAEKEGNNPSILIKSALPSEEESNGLDGVAVSSNAVEVTSSVANSSSNSSQKVELGDEVIPVDVVVLGAGTKVWCERIDKEGVIYTSRVQKYNKPNGTTEVVLQYCIEIGSEEYRWLDWDLLVVM